MKVALYSQTYQDDTLEYVLELLDELRNENAEVAIEADFLDFLHDKNVSGDFDTFNDYEGLDSSFDMFVSFGGDGTILRATTFVRDFGIPIVGVNTGRLGFLSIFNKENVRKVVQEFKQGPIFRHRKKPGRHQWRKPYSRTEPVEFRTQRNNRQP